MNIRSILQTPASADFGTTAFSSLARPGVNVTARVESQRVSWTCCGPKPAADQDLVRSLPPIAGGDGERSFGTKVVTGRRR